jgi:hypothetical protein
MIKNAFLVASAAVATFLVGCVTPIPPGAERGPENTMAYDVLVEASAPGVRIEANGDIVGEAPLHLKLFGDPDGTFHDFGSDFYQVRALPAPGATNQFVQTRLFGTGRLWGPEDKIPQRIYFDMSQPAPKYVPYPVYTPAPYYDPFYYGYGHPFFYGPSFRFNFGGHYHHGSGHYHR